MPDTYLITLLGLVCVLAIALAVLALPIIALLRTRHIAELLERVAALEQQMRFLRGRETVEAPAVQPTTKAETVPSATERPEEEIPTVVPAPRPRPPTPAINLEAWIGGRALGWIAVVLLLFAGGFFLRYVFEGGLIGKLGQVGIGLMLGLGLCAGGLFFHRAGWRIFSQFLTAGGIVLLYLTTFASLAYYNLLPREHAAIFLVAIIAEGALLALVYEAPAIAIMAVIGGLLTPVLLRSDRDQYLSLFTYLVLLDAGFVGLTLFRAWPAIGTVALAGTQVLFWGWFNVHYHPEKRAAALVFQGVLFALFLGYGAVTHVWRQRRANVEDLVRLTLNAFLFTVALFILIEPDYSAWRGTVAMALALVYTLFALLIGRSRPEDARQLFVSVAVSMALVATAFAWQANAAWIALAWAVQGVVLWWFGVRIHTDALRFLGFAFLILAAGRLVFVDTPVAHAEPFVPVLNKYGVPASLIAVALMAAAVVARRLLKEEGDIRRIATRLLGLGGVGLLWFVLSFEGFQFFEMRIIALEQSQARQQRFGDPQGERNYDPFRNQIEQLERTQQMTLSVLWAVYAAVLLAVGFRLPSRPLRWLALGLFGLTLLKVAFVDTATLPGLYRVAAFLALSVMMALGAWGYQKVRVMLAPVDTETHHETNIV